MAARSLLPPSRLRLPLVSSCIVAGLVTVAPGRGDGLAWEFTPARAAAGFAAADGTPRLEATAAPSFAPEAAGGGLVTNVTADVLGATLGPADLPREALTVEAWVAVEMPRRWGGLVGCVQDNGDYEKGWVLGYDEQHFTFGLATEGADDGNGRITYLAGTRPYRAGELHHVVASYDGTTMRLFVDGQLEATADDQSGPVLYDAEAPFAIGAYRDANEDHPLDGRLLAVRILDEVLDGAAVEARFAQRRALSSRPAWTDLELGFLVEPYLTWPTTGAVSVMAETTFPTAMCVRLRAADAPADQSTLHEAPAPARLHEFRIDGLEPNTKYFYEVVAEGLDGAELRSELLSFRTAASRGRPFTFIAIGDTQSQPEVVQRVSDLAYMHRPNLVVHAGDLVATGTSKTDWTEHFFPHMQPLIGRVPLMPVLGNHEQDAEHYYRYMSLPDPERWYSFSYGDADFFMIDGNRSLADQSAQLEWLEGALAASDALWKFAVLHQPPYTSDADDYGDTLVTTSMQGDPNVRNIVGLLERHGVDICFSGHVHDYERTFPILEEQVARHAEGGVIYVTCAGGGGHLEDFDPANTWFGHKKARYHHLVYVAVNGVELEFQAIDEHGQLFDVLTLTKPAGR